MSQKLKPLASTIKRFDIRVVRLPRSQGTIDVTYRSPQYREWRREILRRASFRCEAIEHGQRCSKAYPHHRMYADHIVEIADGGRLFDLANGQCLCGSHHTRKTVEMRAKRWGAG
jgi:5-methylcytosine-specific restriction enzyme A